MLTFTSCLAAPIPVRTFPVLRNVTAYLSNTTWDPIVQALNRGEEVHCVNLKGFRGILSHPTQTGRVFSKEISDRVRVIACLTRLPNILTSERTEEAIDGFAGRKIRNAVNANSNDGLILVWGNKSDIKTAIQEIIIRAKEALIGIPSETRQALPDGTNGFERILPGADRMYPDTDLPPLEITNERIESLRNNVPPALWEREKKYRNMGLPEHLIIPIASTPIANFFEYIVERYKISPIRAARYLFETTIAWKRRNLPLERLTSEIWELFFECAGEQTALLEKGEDILEQFLENSDFNLENELKKYVPSKYSVQQLSNFIDELISSVNEDYKSITNKHRYLMGKIMEQFKGHIPAKQISETLSQKLT